MPQPLRRFVMPPPLVQGPPPFLVSQPSVGQGGPPGIDIQAGTAAIQRMGAPPPLPPGIAEDYAMQSRSADWMYDPQMPTAEEMQVSSAIRQPPAKGASGLRRALANILPAASDLAVSTATGARQPTFLEGLGAGVEQGEHRQQQREQRQIAQRAAEQKAEYDWQKMQIEADKARADIEKSGAEAAKAREETRLMQPKETSQATLRGAQAEAAKGAKRLSELHADHYQQLARDHPAMAEAERNERAARGALYKLQAEMIQAKISAGMPQAEAKLTAAQEARQAAEAKLAGEKVKSHAEEVSISRMRAGALDRQSTAALMNAQARGLAGVLTPRDVMRQRNNYAQAVAKLQADIVIRSQPEQFQGAKAFLDQQYADFLPGGKHAAVLDAAGAPPPPRPGGGDATWEEYKNRQR
jgi:hypothetical protein